MYPTLICVCGTLMVTSLLIPGHTHAASSPHIIIVLADDLGWNDVSFHGSNQILTANIDALAYSGVILQDYYTQPICTPARAALLTGRHPIHNGMQHDLIYAPQPWGLPLSEILMPQYLKSRGYVTHGIGKWHLGFSKAEYTPSERGFDSYFGSWLGHQNQFTHMAYARHKGYDLHRNLNIAWEGKGRYAADLFTEEAETLINSHDVDQPLFLYLSHTAPHSPLQAPPDEIDKFKHISQEKRRIYAAMVSKVDESVGRVTQALKNKNMLNNSIILFLSDNGGATNGYNGNVASNWPLRGGKDTLWEGGVRGVGLIWSPLLKGAPRVHHGLFNVQDWLPTLLSASGSDQTKELSQLDGVSQWKALNNEAPNPYTTVLHNIDPIRKIAALREGNWKIIIGRTHRGIYDGWYGRERSKHPYDFKKIKQSATGQALTATSRSLPTSSTMQALRSESTVSCIPKKHKGAVYTRRCMPHRAPCLFNIREDPCEINNVARLHPQLVAHMLENLLKYHLVRPRNKVADRRSYPIYWNHTWTNWQDSI